MIYVEPTPYVLGFIRCVVTEHKGVVESLFIAANVSQPWNLELDAEALSFLPPGFIRAAVEIRRRISSGRYELLHLAGWGHPLLIWALTISALHRIPVVMESDTQLSTSTALWKRALKRLLYPLLFRIPKLLLPAGTRQAAYFRHYGAKEDRIVHAQMTVDVAEIARRTDAMRRDGMVAGLRARFGIASEAIVFVFVGRLEHPRKGIRTLLEAFTPIARQRNDVALLIAGDGTERGRVEAAAASNASIRYAGRLDWEGIVGALCCADVSVVPSTIEPFGLVVNEAMAAGLPVIASDRVGCLEDLVKDGETGLTFQAGNVDRLVASMLRLADDREERRRMGAAAHRLIAGWTLEEQARITVTSWERCRIAGA